LVRRKSSIEALGKEKEEGKKVEGGVAGEVSNSQKG
jgi:hypothetical protein